MNWLKKFLIVFVSFLPLSAGAVVPFVIGGIAGITAIAGWSVYRSISIVDMNSAMQFFSTCWSCDLFSSIMLGLSNILPKVYHALGMIIIPFSLVLTAIWIAWELLSRFIGGTKFEFDGWSIAGKFGTHIIKISFVIALLLAPLPRFITDVVINPIFNIGLSMNHVINYVDDDSNRQRFAECVISTAINEESIQSNLEMRGAFSPNLRHNLACELSTVHQMTGLGMTVGWTMLNMAFNREYMHKILWTIPIFPNVPIFFAGLLIFVLFFIALIPVPLYFLEVFVTLAMDLVMLPLMLLSWLFTGWKIFPSGKENIKKMIDNVISGTIGIAMVGVFVTFAIMFLNAVFGNMDGAIALQTAIQKNDSKFLMDALVLNNTSLITVILMGIFITMFMIMIPTLIKTWFNVSVSQKYYDTAKKDMTTMWNGLKKWVSAAKK